MTAAYRLKGLGWFAGCAVVTLGFYLVSSQVAAERRKLEQVDAKIVAAERDVRALETEFDTRANLAQLERWNGDTLALVAPTAGQFVRDEAQLASISFNGAGSAGVRTAAYVVPAFTAQVAAPVSVPGTAATAQASVSVPAPVADVAAKPAITATAAITRSAGTAVASIAKPATSRKAQAVAMLDRTLLSDSTIGDLLSGARSEAGRLR